MTCKHYDCFTCPYPDCIVSTRDACLNPDKLKERALKRKEYQRQYYLKKKAKRMANT